jgi:hypothetical protein
VNNIIPILLIFLALHGCSESKISYSPRFPVDVTVTFNGTPATGTVSISPSNAVKGSGAIGTGGDLIEGQFKSKDGLGASIGSHLIYIQIFDPKTVIPAAQVLKDPVTGETLSQPPEVLGYFQKTLEVKESGNSFTFNLNNSDLKNNNN